MKQGRRGVRFGAGLALGLLVAGGLAGCSSGESSGINPIGWYRDLTGASADDAEDRTAANGENLKEGQKEPYPNLASVPAPPDTAMSRIDRKKLAQSLVADRTNAEYTNQQFIPGQNAAAIPAPAVPPPNVAATASTTAAPGAEKHGKKQANRSAHRMPKRGSERPPAESALRSPTIGAMPLGAEAEAPPPVPPGVVRHREQLATTMPGEGESAPGAAGLVAEIHFIGGGSQRAVLDADEAQLAGIARRAMRDNARIRIVGHGGGAGEGDPAQRKFESFDVALDNAKSVAVALTRLGMPANRIVVETAAKADSSDRADIYLED